MSVDPAGRIFALPLGLLVMMGLAACGEPAPPGKGGRCSESQPCAKGLRCSFKDKRCYAPVDCDALAKRLEVCARELLETFSPEARKLPSAERVKRVDTIREKLRTEVVEHCRFDAATHKKQKGTTPPKEKSWGEDPKGDALNGCLVKASCQAFATCFLTAANVLGPGARDPARLPIFPVALPRPVPDGGVDLPPMAGDQMPPRATPSRVSP